MKCKHCDGDGVIVDVEYGHAGKYMCDYCWGTGVVEPLTEQEYLQTCNTEQLVHVIHLMTTCCYVCGQVGVDYKRCYFHKKCTGPKEIEEWLKQPHAIKE